VEEHYRGSFEFCINEQKIELLLGLYKGTRGDHKTIQFFSGQTRPEVERKTAS